MVPWRCLCARDRLFVPQDAVTARMVVTPSRNADLTRSTRPWRIVNVMLSCHPHAKESQNSTAIAKLLMKACKKFKLAPITVTTDSCSTNAKAARVLADLRSEECLLPMQRVPCMAHA